MRQVRVPFPAQTWEVLCEGPFSPAAPDARSAQVRLQTALAGVPDADRRLGTDGWTVVWESAPQVAGALLKVWLWCTRSDHAPALQRALGGLLEGAGFVVRVRAQPISVDVNLQPRAVYVRAGPHALGLEPRTCGMFATAVLVEAEEDRTDVDLGITFRLASQRCPSCGVEDHPAALVGGFPDQELLLAAELGEVAFVDGGTVDRRRPKNARCRHCHADFVAR
jgi:hypothetical protein